jgi:serine/threonine protein kinase/tetratricopeptide (TPR) repeat protein
MSMKCPKCQFENSSDSSFCSKCGTQISPVTEASPSPTETLQVSIKELSAGSSFAGRYHIYEELGKGGMGRVYKALDKEIQEKVALKLLNPDVAADSRTIERFRNELKTARQISHKNVCRMYHFGKDEGAFYITMEYVRGEDLKSMIKMMGRLSPGQTIMLAKQVCEGLAEAHRLGVVHRDLKPQNIMIDRDGNVKIMDFGIARSLKAKGITGAGMMIGTPEYMSPEQVEGKDADERSDLYALGIILYEMLTGKVPFEGETPLSVALKQKTELPEDPAKINPQISDDLRRVILRCLEKEKENRIQKAGELIAEFDRIEKSIPTAEKILPPRKPLTSKEFTVNLRKSWRIIAAVAIVAVFAGAAILYFGRGRPIPATAKNKLVVLPFENLGPPEDDYFADGITDEINARLTGISELGVIARNSAVQYKKTSKSIKQIGEELGVDFVLSGTIRWQKPEGGSSQVRVTPTLSRVSDSTQIWANVYEQKISQIFQVQSDIARKVVEELGLALNKTERQSLEVKPTENIAAYDYYLRGNDFTYRGRDVQGDLDSAIVMYEKAVSLDPNFFQAYAMLSRTHSLYYWYYYDRSEERVAEAKRAADRAFELNPDAAETRMALGYYFYHCRLDYEQALKNLDFALEKQPKNVLILEAIGYVKRRQGRFSETIANLKLVLEIDPRYAQTAFNLGETYVLVRDYKEAERYYDRALFLNPDYPRAYALKTRLYLSWEGDTQKARQVLEEAARATSSREHNLVAYAALLVDIYERRYQDALQRLSSSPYDVYEDQFCFVPRAELFAQIFGLMNKKAEEKKYYDAARIYVEDRIKAQPDDSRFWSALGIAYAGLGRKEEAIQSAEKAVELLPISKEAYRGTFRAKDLAQVYVMVGEYDKAFDQIEHLLSIPGELSLPILKIDPVWAPLRDRPRFQKLLERYE